MTQKQIQYRRVLIVAAIIVVLVVAFIGASIVYNKLPHNQLTTQTQLGVTISTNQTSILQGTSIKIPINISLTGNPENVDLTSIVNSSKINCYFDPANGSSSFNTTLTVNVDDSAQGGNYSVTLKASSPTTAANASSIITVLSRNIIVSGHVNLMPDKLNSEGWNVQITSLMFEDTRTNENVTIEPKDHVIFIPKNLNFYNMTDQTFRVTLKNQDFYNVTANYAFGIVDFFPFSGSVAVGNLTVSAPAGSNMMPAQDFTVTPEG